MRDAIVKFPKKTDELFLDIPKEPASILLDDIEKVMVVRLEHNEFPEKDQYPGCPYPPSHHTD